MLNGEKKILKSNHKTVECATRNSSLSLINVSILVLFRLRSFFFELVPCGGIHSKRVCHTHTNTIGISHLNYYYDTRLGSGRGKNPTRNEKWKFFLVFFIQETVSFITVNVSNVLGMHQG